MELIPLVDQNLLKFSGIIQASTTKKKVPAELKILPSLTSIGRGNSQGPVVALSSKSEPWLEFGRSVQAPCQTF